MKDSFCEFEHSVVCHCKKFSLVNVITHVIELKFEFGKLISVGKRILSMESN